MAAPENHVQMTSTSSSSPHSGTPTVKQSSRSSFSHEEVLERYQELEKRAETLLHHGIFPSFTSDSLNNAYALSLKDKNKSVLIRSYVVLLLYAGGQFTYWSLNHPWQFNAAEIVLLALLGILFISLHCLLLLRIGNIPYLANDTSLAACLSVAIFTLGCTSFSRIGYVIEGDPSYLILKHRCLGDVVGICRTPLSDTRECLVLCLAVLFSQQFFYIRANRSWIVSVTGSLVYAGLCVPGVSPPGIPDQNAGFAGICMFAVCAWLGRRTAEIHDRRNWVLNRLLNSKFDYMVTKYESAGVTMPSPMDHVRERVLDQLEHEDDDSDDSTLMLHAREQFRRLKLREGEITDELRSLRKKASEQAGVSVAYLLEDFKGRARTATNMLDPAFLDIKDAFWFCESPIGREMTCPRDGRRGCALIDTLPKIHRKRASHFLSWVWSYKLNVVLGALQAWIASEYLDPKGKFLYMCFFVNNQFRLLVDRDADGADNLGGTFEENLHRIGNVIAVLDTWSKPQYLERIWTIFEQFTAIRLDIPVRMVLPPDAAQSLIDVFDEGKTGILRVRDALCQVDAARAHATFENDEIKVRALIQESIGFDAVNQEIKNFMVHWVATSLEARMTSLVQTETPPRETTDDFRSLFPANADSEAEPASAISLQAVDADTDVRNTHKPLVLSVEERFITHDVSRVTAEDDANSQCHVTCCTVKI